MEIENIYDKWFRFLCPLMFVFSLFITSLDVLRKEYFFAVNQGCNAFFWISFYFMHKWGEERSKRTRELNELVRKSMQEHIDRIFKASAPPFTADQTKDVH